VVSRVEKMGDLFAPVLELKQRLPDLKGVAASASAESQPPGAIAAQAEAEPENVPRRAVRKTGTRPRKPRRKV
jgi:hypothetical protein